MPIEFRYVFVPRAARVLNWTVVTAPDPRCDGGGYTVTVFDLNSRRGPSRSVTKTFAIPPGLERDSASLGMEPLRGQIVAIRFSTLSSLDRPPCVGWADVSLAE